MMLEGGDEISRVSDGGGRFACYIEEPEAHLFPDFQRLITERIAEYANSQGRSQDVFITTHSPYVLSTINNLLLAGRLAEASGTRKRVAKIVPPSMWLESGTVTAYSICNGGSVSIMDDDSGLIDADYLDSVSVSIGRVFNDLLSIEFPDTEVVSE